ncbi:MAG: methylmalonyl Co-A mutase-associated GTPase MeaB [Saprospiraceae bacterium]|jgi:LAO/AO transport system kinase
MSKQRPGTGSTMPLNKGGAPQGQFNPEIESFFHRRPVPSVDLLEKGIQKGDRVILGQAITLVESSLPRQQAIAQELIGRCIPRSGKAFRIGISGAPGVGKSTFIEAFGKAVVAEGHRLAVLAIDPSSQLSKGSILGDKTRMQQLATLDQVFIRPSPSGGSVGGVARKTREAIILCEAAGFDVIVVETVGVGQSETAVHAMVDFFLLLLLPGAGDELQGIKRGIVEMADGLAVNKADGDNLPLARLAMAAYSAALHLFPPKASGWNPTVQLCSATTGDGIRQIWLTVLDYLAHTRKSGFFVEKRRVQARYWMYETINERLQKIFFDHPSVQSAIGPMENQVQNGTLSPFHAAEGLLDVFLKTLGEAPNR